MPTGFLFLLVFLIILAASAIKVVSESQRLVVYRLGRFFGLRGPGLVYVIPGVDKCTKIAIGDQGKLISHDVATVRKIDVPGWVLGSGLKN